MARKKYSDYDSKIINFRSSLRFTRRCRERAMQHPVLAEILKTPVGETILVQMILAHRKKFDRIAIPGGKRVFIGSRVNERQVRTMIEYMIENGVISLIRRGSKSDGICNVYTFHEELFEGFIPRKRGIVNVMLASHQPNPNTLEEGRYKKEDLCGTIQFRDSHKTHLNLKDVFKCLDQKKRKVVRELINGYRVMYKVARYSYTDITFDHAEAFKGQHVSRSRICSPDQDLLPSPGEGDNNHFTGSNAPSPKECYIGKTNLHPRIIFNFNNNRIGGGRVYHDVFSRLNSDERLYLRMYGQRVVEVDIVSSQMRFCYALEGMSIPDDFYETIGRGNRGLGKAIALVMIGADIDFDGGDLLQAINKSRIFKEKNYDPITEEHYAFIQSYMGPTLWAKMGRAMWMDLQLVEATYLQKVFSAYHARTSRYLLTCHDSFMAPESDEELLISIMKATWAKMFPGIRFSYSVDRTPVTEEDRKQRKVRQWPTTFKQYARPKKTAEAAETAPVAPEGQEEYEHEVLTLTVPHEKPYVLRVPVTKKRLRSCDYDNFHPPPPS